MAKKLIRVIFVDDEVHILRGLRRSMSEMEDEWDMVFCPSAAEALERMSREPFDVVVSDMRMPGMDGAQFLNTVRDRWPATVRAILSGYAESEAIFRTVGPAHIYLAKPCDAAVLQAAIRRQAALHEILDNPDLRALLAGITSLPSLPEPFLRLVAELRSPNASSARIAQIIGQDVAMTAELLKLTNSAYFSVASHVATPLQAVRLLGLETVQSLVLRIGIFRQFSGTGATRPLLEALTRNSLMIARLAEGIAVAEGADQPTAKSAYCAAMLSDIGCVALIDGQPETYRRVLSRVSTALPLPEAERQEFGANHGLIGGYLLGLWGFADRIVEAVTYSCDLRTSATRNNLVLVALLAARALGPPMPLLPAECPDGCTGMLDYLTRTFDEDQLKRWRDLAGREKVGLP
ncbi:MAG: HDOD domain-containing protein [Alphaproteobacteria bacterium]|nr:HDOD domain-containing protein [Alphaproteobacteria bacterium]